MAGDASVRDAAVTPTTPLATTGRWQPLLQCLQEAEYCDSLAHTTCIRKQLCPRRSSGDQLLPLPRLLLMILHQFMLLLKLLLHLQLPLAVLLRLQLLKCVLLLLLELLLILLSLGGSLLLLLLLLLLQLLPQLLCLHVLLLLQLQFLLLLLLLDLEIWDNLIVLLFLLKLLMLLLQLLLLAQPGVLLTLLVLLLLLLQGMLLLLPILLLLPLLVLLVKHPRPLLFMQLYLLLLLSVLSTHELLALLRTLALRINSCRGCTRRRNRSVPASKQPAYTRALMRLQLPSSPQRPIHRFDLVLAGRRFFQRWRGVTSLLHAGAAVVTTSTTRLLLLAKPLSAGGPLLPAPAPFIKLPPPQTTPLARLLSKRDDPVLYLRLALQHLGHRDIKIWTRTSSIHGRSAAGCSALRAMPLGQVRALRPRALQVHGVQEELVCARHPDRCLRPAAKAAVVGPCPCHRARAAEIRQV
jgi:hypothetical protein